MWWCHMATANRHGKSPRQIATGAAQYHLSLLNWCSAWVPDAHGTRFITWGLCQVRARSVTFPYSLGYFFLIMRQMFFNHLPYSFLSRTRSLLSEIFFFFLGGGGLGFGVFGTTRRMFFNHLLCSFLSLTHSQLSKLDLQFEVLNEPSSLYMSHRLQPTSPSNCSPTPVQSLQWVHSAIPIDHHWWSFSEI